MKHSQINDAFLVVAENADERARVLDFLKPEPARPELPTQGYAVPTFHCIGLYWAPPVSLPKHTGCPVRFAERVAGAAWIEGFPLHYDDRSLTDPVSNEPHKKVRGSIVHLKPDTEYVVQFGLCGADGKPEWKAQLTARTWSEKFKEARVVKISSQNSTLVIPDGGSKEQGYVVYQADGDTTIDVQGDADWNAIIQKPYVILRGLKLRGAKKGAICLAPGVTDVVIEDNDISDWGTLDTSGRYGVNRQAAITNLMEDTGAAQERAQGTKRIIVQRNRIHDPRYGSNDWSEGHPSGPHAIAIFNSGGNHVIRYNDIYASENNPQVVNKFFNDAMGGGENAGPKPGFPGNDSDIYCNDIRNHMDDGIEAEGHGCNVRIWGNRLNHGAASYIATNTTHVGPIYIWRNVAVGAGVGDKRSPAFFKTGDRGGYGGGRRFFFHNTVVTPHVGRAIDDVNVVVNGCYARNNIWQMHPKSTAAYTVEGPDNSLDYNMSNKSGWGKCPAGSEKNGILNASPIFKLGKDGDYQLAADSPGKGKAQALPNFNRCAGADLGAHEEGEPPMKFGLAAAQ
jgi:hypothetical protein